MWYESVFQKTRIILFFIPMLASFLLFYLSFCFMKGSDAAEEMRKNTFRKD